MFLSVVLCTARVIPASILLPVKMAAADTHTLVDQVSQCQSTVEDLLKQDAISADAEGVHLGMEGPLTLLKIGRSDGHVILFDIQSGGKEMFTDGRLQELLESDKVLKVMYGCSNDSLSLHCQFGVDLTNVYDIQTAQQTRDRAKGRQLPSYMKLIRLCGTYLPSVIVPEKKKYIQKKWDKTEGEYWAKRPMTDEMIDYACLDMQLLLQIYQKQKGFLQSEELWEQFQRDVQVDLRCRWDEAVKEEENKKKEAIIHDIFKTMEGKYHEEPKIEVIKDEDEIQALKRTFTRDVKELSPTIQTLKYQQVKQEIDEIKVYLAKQGTDYVPKQHSFSVFLSALDHPDEAVQTLAKDLLTKCNNILKDDMAVKYTLSTPLKHTTVNEQRMLRTLRPKCFSDSNYDPVVLRLYWDLMEEDVNKDMDSFSRNKAAYAVREGYIKKVKFYMVANGVPSQLKEKARLFISDLQNYGKIARPTIYRPRKARSPDIKFRKRRFNENQKWWN